MITPKVLLIDDEKRLRCILKLVLQDAGYDVQTAADGKEGIVIWDKWMPEVVISDLKMEPMDGLEVLKFRNQKGLSTPVIILTAFGTIDTAVGAMKDNAFDYLTKPIDNNKLLGTVAKALKVAAASNNNNTSEMIGSSPAMMKIRRNIKLFASSDSSVLITGASGTGKELVARAIHEASPRKNGPFIKVNCAAIPHELMESELFGHKKGSFTGALNNHEGAFSRASKGILFLDEIGDLPLLLQPKLLNAVEEKVITPIGSGKQQDVDIKILSATNHNLAAMITKQLFREDLYYRLNTVNIHLPLLAERKSDIDLLVRYFLSRFSLSDDKPQLRIDKEAYVLLNQWQWPGNVRELSNVIERAVLTSQGNTITPDHLPPQIQHQNCSDNNPSKDLPLDLAAQEKSLIFTSLEESDWNQSMAARRLRISRNTLRYRMKKYKLAKS